MNARGRRDIFASKNRDNSLTEETVSKIKQRINEGEAIRDIARDMGVKYSIVYNIRKEYSWKSTSPQITIPKDQALKRKLYRIPDPSTNEAPMPAGWGYITKK